MSSAPEDGPVDRAAGLEELQLVVRARLPRPEGFVRNALEGGLGGEHLFDDGEVVRVIRGDAEEAARLECPGGGGRERGVEEAALVMAFLGPRVGKVDVQDDEGGGEQALFDERLSVQPLD